MTPTQAFGALGIAKTNDISAVRRAYAEKLKAMDVDRDVAGFARLRDARDAALRWARMQATTVVVEDTADAATDTDAQPDEVGPDAGGRETSSWLFAAPELAGTPDPSLTTRLGQSAQSLDVTPGFAQAQAPAEQAIAVNRNPFTRPVLLGLEQNADAVMPAWAHEQALHRLLLPETEDADLPPLEGWEEAMARGHLKSVLHNAETVSVTAFDEVDNWLGSLLARSWPRSAPLLEPAAHVFGWESERGQVSERPAVAFLNARLRGLRFREKVEVPGHPLHKAWTELTTPAQQGSRKGWFVKRSDVEQLLAGVRKNFPELEHHFDDWRVALWKRQDQSGANSWWSKTRLIIFAVILLAQIARFATSGTDRDRQTAEAPQPVSTSQTDNDKAIVSRAVTAIFGGDVTFEQVQARQPDLAALFSANRTIARSENDSDDAYIAKVRDLVRERMYMTALTVKGPVLEDVQRIRADVLRAAQLAGPAQCMAYIRTRRLAPDVTMGVSVLLRERDLARRMLDARQLGPPARVAGGRTSVPSELVAKVVESTGIGDARVRQAMNGRGSDADQCAVTIALIDAALAAPAKDRQAILSVL